MSSSRTRLLGVLVALLTLAGTPALASAATPPAGMFGTGGWAWPTTADLDRGGAHGLSTWRVVMDYKSVGQVQGTLNFSGYDALVADAARRGVTPMFTLTGCPAWSCPAGGPAATGAALVDWKAFVTAAVRRYGSAGTFWASNPTVPRRPVTAWQVGNEVNGALQWPNPSPAAYGAFLVATAPAIRGVDPQARVVLSGLPEKMDIWMKDFLAGLYQQPGFKDAVDVIAVHGYAVATADVPVILDTARRIMLANGDAATPLWITEMSWATGGPAHPFVTTEADQAARLRTSWDTLLGCRSRWNLERTYWYSHRDRAVGGAIDYWGFHNGLRRLDGTAKPALTAFEEYTAQAPLPGGRGDTCSLPGGTVLDTTVPDTTITSDVAARTGQRRPAFAFSASEPGVRFQCHFAGAPWTTCVPGTDGLWRPSADLAGGTQTLSARAVDAQGNTDASVASRSFVVDTMAPDTYVAGTWGNVSGRTVTLTLSSNEAASRYECRLDSGVWATCGTTYTTTFAPGNHTISVRAYDLAGLVDPNPATPWYKIV